MTVTFQGDSLPYRTRHDGKSPSSALHSPGQHLGSVRDCRQVITNGNYTGNIFNLRSANNVNCRIIGPNYSDMYENLISDLELHYFDAGKTGGERTC